MKTSELTGPVLDWAVAKCENVEPDETHKPIWFGDGDERVEYTPSTDWSQGGPIIEREGLQLRKRNDFHFPAPFWQAGQWSDITLMPGPTPLIAAMRCYVKSKLGDDVDIPQELL